MRKIILARHGKSAWNNPFLADHDRPLAQRGLDDIPKMAFRLKKRKMKPDLMLTSSAKRAADTARITARELGIPESKIVVEKNLYHASPNLILKHIRMVHDQVKTLMVFGHNPGFNELIEYLGGKLDNLPTSGQYAFEADIEHWSELGPENAKFLFVDYPKKKN